MKLSIIVPVYGVEKYIRECILSIINQEDDLFKQIELILVNDGTKDKSIEQVQDIIAAHHNIVLINQQNQGLSMARNNGIKLAKGEYVWCVDSDDWISSNSLKVLLPLLDGDCDLLKMYAIERTDSGQQKKVIPFSRPVVFSGPETFRNGCAQIATSVLLVYRKNFIEKYNLSFMPGVYHEDNEFCPRVCYLSKRTVVIPEYLYIIRRTTSDGRQSITTSVNPKRAFDMLKCMQSLAKFNDEIVQEKFIKNVIDTWICQGFTIALDVIIKCDASVCREFNYCFYSKYRSLLFNLSHGNLKFKVESLLFNLFPHHITSCYKFLNCFNPRYWKMYMRRITTHY